jgi:hypothetical protein
MSFFVKRVANDGRYYFSERFGTIDEARKCRDGHDLNRFDEIKIGENRLPTKNEVSSFTSRTGFDGSGQMSSASWKNWYSETKHGFFIPSETRAA